MNETSIKPADVLAAALPTIGGLTLSQWNTVASLVGTLLGIAYLLWKWRKDAKSKE